MKRIILAALLLAPVAASAQSAPPATPQVQALIQTITKLMGESIDWQTQAIAAQQQIAGDRVKIEELQKQLAAATAAKPTETPKKE